MPAGFRVLGQPMLLRRSMLGFAGSYHGQAWCNSKFGLDNYRTWDMFEDVGQSELWQFRVLRLMRFRASGSSKTAYAPQLFECLNNIQCRA